MFLVLVAHGKLLRSAVLFAAPLSNHTSKWFSLAGGTQQHQIGASKRVSLMTRSLASGQLFSHHRSHHHCLTIFLN